MSSFRCRIHRNCFVAQFVAIVVEIARPFEENIFPHFYMSIFFLSARPSLCVFSPIFYSRLILRVVCVSNAQSFRAKCTPAKSQKFAGFLNFKLFLRIVPGEWASSPQFPVRRVFETISRFSEPHSIVLRSQFFEISMRNLKRPNRKIRIQISVCSERCLVPESSSSRKSWVNPVRLAGFVSSAKTRTTNKAAKKPEIGGEWTNVAINCPKTPHANESWHVPRLESAKKSQKNWKLTFRISFC